VFHNLAVPVLHLFIWIVTFLSLYMDELNDATLLLCCSAALGLLIHCDAVICTCFDKLNDDDDNDDDTYVLCLSANTTTKQLTTAGTWRRWICSDRVPRPSDIHCASLWQPSTRRNGLRSQTSWSSMSYKFAVLQSTQRQRCLDQRRALVTSPSPHHAARCSLSLLRPAEPIQYSFNKLCCQNAQHTFTHLVKFDLIQLIYNEYWYAFQFPYSVYKITLRHYVQSTQVTVHCVHAAEARSIVKHQ